MFLNKKIKFVYSFGQIRLGLAAFMLAVLPAALGSETYRITTYYPAPIASYHQTRALTRVIAGNNAAVQLGSSIFTGIDYGTIRTPEISTATAGGDIVLAPGNEIVIFGGRVFNFCRWRRYNLTDTSNANAKDTPNAYCPNRWAAVAMSRNRLDNGNGMRYVSSSDIESGYMLCCRFTTLNN